MNKLAVVIGGGKVAARKVQALLDANAKITVVSPQMIETLHDLVRKGKIQWRKKYFHPADLNGAFIVIAATNDHETNREIVSCCHSHQLVNVVSNPELGNFHVPAVLRRGKLTIAVSTQGAAPMLAKKIRDELGQMYDDTYADYVDQLEKKRKHIIRTVSDPLERQAELEKIVQTESDKR